MNAAKFVVFVPNTNKTYPCDTEAEAKEKQKQLETGSIWELVGEIHDSVIYEPVRGGRFLIRCRQKDVSRSGPQRK